jgi:PTS system cellobiose-specific IIA component
MDIMEVAMNLIAGAGDAKSDAMEAIMHAKAGDIPAARVSIEKASEAMLATHAAQTQLIREEMSGKPLEVTLLMVHAQDHLCTAQLMREIAIEIIDLYEKIGGK